MTGLYLKWKCILGWLRYTNYFVGEERISFCWPYLEKMSACKMLTVFVCFVTSVFDIFCESVFDVRAIY